MARIPIAPEWLVEGEDTATCPVCLMVLVQPTIGCPEGHALCKTCYLQELGHRQGSLPASAEPPLAPSPEGSSRLRLGPTIPRRDLSARPRNLRRRETDWSVDRVLLRRKMCPCCRHATDESRLQKCRLAEVSPARATQTHLFVHARCSFVCMHIAGCTDR